MRTARLLLPVLALACLTAQAQTSASPSATTLTEVRLGDSFIPLTGPWKFTPGDSPQASPQASPQPNGTPLWASPAFDDAAWTDMDLHSNPGATDNFYGNTGYIKGWSRRGFPLLSGFAWYRLRIHLAPSSELLWLKMPVHNDDSYQLFANGQYLGEFGQFTPTGVFNYRSRPLSFQLPAPDEHGDILLAVRFYMEPFVLLTGSTGDSGGMRQTPLLGTQSQIQSIREQEFNGRTLRSVDSVFVIFLVLIAAAGAFWIWLLDRPRTTYLWLTLALVLTATHLALLLSSFFSDVLTQGSNLALLQVFTTLSLVCWILFWRRWFLLTQQRWLDILLAIVVATSAVTGIVFALSTHISVSVDLFALELRAAYNMVLGVMLFVALLQGARKDRIDALLAFPPIILLTISLFSVELLAWFHISTSFFPFGVKVTVADVALTLLVLVVGALVARHFVASQVSQRLERHTIDQDLEQARELQQRVLIPEPITSSLFAVETAYVPARTVGGDFFQVVPYADGSLLIVVGDVSGKGMAAAMLVAVLVGAVRTRAEETSDPAAVLRTLNDRLLGRAGDHFATCIAAHLRPGGAMLIANAGHLPPYRNGVATDLPGSMPLGIVPGAEYDTHALQLSPADLLTFVTDGVPEARNATGALLGFDRLAELSSLPPDAIARAAIAYGQDDDITIVSVRLRAAAVETSAALEALRA